MPVTMDDLVARVNSEATNTKVLGTARSTGDGASISFLIAPHARYVLDDDDFGAFIDGVADTDGTMNHVTGVYTFGLPPSSAQVLQWTFNYARWPDDMVAHAIDSSIAWLFPAYYYATKEIVQANGDLYEFTLITQGVEYITKIEKSSTGVPPWTKIPRTKWDVIRDGSDKSVKFFSAPSEGSLRLSLILRPGWVVDDPDAQVLTYSLNIPDVSEHPIVSYACYYLMQQKTAPRTFADVAVVTQGTGTLSPRMMMDGANAFLSRAMMQVQSMRMTPWSMY